MELESTLEPERECSLTEEQGWRGKLRLKECEHFMLIALLAKRHAPGLK